MNGVLRDIFSTPQMLDDGTSKSSEIAVLRYMQPQIHTHIEKPSGNSCVPVKQASSQLFGKHMST